MLPVLCVGFLHERPARHIFEHWRQKYGDIDQLEEIRVSIVEGPIDGEQGYSVQIGPNHEGAIKRLNELGHKLTGGETFFTISRINRMIPVPGSKHLEIFKQQFSQHKRYLLAPGIASDGGRTMQPLFDLGIQKTTVHFRNVSEIGENDEDSGVLHEPKE